MRKNIYKEVAAEVKLPDYLVEKVARHPMKMLMQTMSKGEFEGIMLKHFGKFIVKPGRLKFLNRYDKTPSIYSNDPENSGGSGENNSVELEVPLETCVSGDNKGSSGSN